MAKWCSFESLWGNERLADGKLILRDTIVTKPKKKKRKGESLSEEGEELRRLPIHRVIWAANSEYFEAQFQRWSNTTNETNLHILPDEVDAFEQVVKFFYFGRFDEAQEGNLDLLFTVLEVADRIQAKSCVDAAISLLVQCMSDCISDISLCLKNTLRFFDMSSGLTENPILRKFFDDGIYELFGNVDSVVQNKTYLNDFSKLPLCAVVALLSRDDLRVSSENSVLLMAMSWVELSKVQVLHPQTDLNELAESIRIGCLSSLFFEQILPQAKWLSLTTTQHNVLSLFVHTKHSKYDRMFWDSLLQDSEASFPTSWLSVPRKSLLKPSSKFVLCEATFLEKELDEFIRLPTLQKTFASKPTFWRGYMWTPIIKLSDNEEHSVRAIGCHVQIGDNRYDIVGQRAEAIFVTCERSEKIKCWTTQREAYGRTGHAWLFGEDGVQKSACTSFLRDGKIVVTVKILNCF